MSDLNAALALQIITNVFGAMKTGPSNLGKYLDFVSSMVSPGEAFAEQDLMVWLGSNDVNDPVKAEVKRQLQRWDWEGYAPWIAGTDKNTPERRQHVYDLLGVHQEYRNLLDATFPPYITTLEPIVVIADEHEPWYHPSTLEKEFYWNAYCQQLREVADWPEESIQILADSTSKVVERISDPTRKEAYQAKGLVVGYVQSGKTANFTGVIAKAADAGYRLIIVLAGTTDNLRQQTQRRIDKELIGVELLEDDYIDDDDYNAFLRHGAMPSSLGAFDWQRLTGPDDDYQALRQGIEALNFRPSDPALPFYDPANLHRATARIMVVKKNPSVLKKVAKDLKRIKEKKQVRLEDIPTLVIDDESDQASVDTTRPNLQQRKKRTATNQAIVGLLKELPRAQYVGYTATPFANVFINPEDAADLFPKDFLIPLPRPKGYMGASDFHDLGDETPEGYLSNERAFVRPVTGSDEQPQNLLRALDAYVLSGAIKLFRAKRAPQIRFKHHTMLVHHSQSTATHDAVASVVGRLLETAGYDAGPGLQRLENLWLNDFMLVSRDRDETWPPPATFGELLPHLGECLHRLHSDGRSVMVVNGDHDAPDFDRKRVWKILVGGVKLSRGYTVEGLTVSYYRRVARAADTLMQMGRWFGFREGYQDLVRLFIGTKEPLNKHKEINLYQAFEAVCRDEMDFRADLQRYAMPSNGTKPVTPMQVPPLVPAHLLQPTSPNKMYNAVIKSQNFGGKNIQSTLAPYTDKDVFQNEEALRSLLRDRILRLRVFKAEIEATTVQNQSFVTEVEPSHIIEFLKAYRWVDGDSKKLELQLEFLSGKYGDPEIDRWLFVAPKAGTDSAWTVNDVDIPIVERSRTETPGGRYGVYTTSRDVKLAMLLRGETNGTGLSADLTELIQPRQAVFLFYPVRDDNDPEYIITPEGRQQRFVTMGFSLMLPNNRIQSNITFGVKNSKKENEVVVDADLQDDLIGEVP